MKKISVTRWLIVASLFAILANVAHPVTPRFIKELGLGDSVFGYAYAGMAITNFIFSPLWSKLGQKFGSVKCTIICLSCYAFSQFLFRNSTTFAMIIFARLLGGFFIGGIYVTMLLYVVENQAIEKRAETLVKFTTAQIFFGAIGYLVGGRVGDINVENAFNIQIIGLLLTAVFVLLMIKDKDRDGSLIKIKDVNPLSSLKINNIDNKTLIYFLYISIVASMATVLHDQSLNYYMNDFFNLPPSSNGMIKATTGILVLAFNTIITTKIISRANLNKVMAAIFSICASLVLSLTFVYIPNIFILINIVYVVVNAMYLPIIQNIITSTASDQAQAVGTVNSLKSLGMILGAILAGVLYPLGKQLPFIVAAIIFIIALILCIKVTIASDEN